MIKKFYVMFRGVPQPVKVTLKKFGFCFHVTQPLTITHAHIRVVGRAFELFNGLNGNTACGYTYDLKHTDGLILSSKTKRGAWEAFEDWQLEQAIEQQGREAIEHASGLS